MSTTYNGSATSTQSPSPAPEPAADLTITIPADGDPLAAQSVNQALKTLADGTTYVQKSARLSPQIAQLATASGFSAVTHTGGGAGTITPNGGAQPWTSVTTAGRRINITITTSGTQATAAYTYDINDGAGPVGPATMAASITIAGVVIACSGNFVSGDTYEFSQLDTPRIQMTDHAGNLRHVLSDHFGYPSGSNDIHMREQWSQEFTKSASAGVITAKTDWRVSSSQAGNLLANSANITPAGAGTYPCGRVNPGGTDGDNCYLTYLPELFEANVPTSMTAVVRWNVIMSSGLTDQRFFSGLVRSGTTFQSHTALGTDFIAIYKISSGGTWLLASRAAATETDLDSGVTATDGQMYRMRLEISGSASCVGAKLVRFFIDGKPVGTMTTNIPAFVMQFSFGSIMTATNTSHDFACSQVDICYNPSGAATGAL